MPGYDDVAINREPREIKFRGKACEFRRFTLGDLALAFDGRVDTPIRGCERHIAIAELSTERAGNCHGVVECRHQNWATRDIQQPVPARLHKTSGDFTIFTPDMNAGATAPLAMGIDN